MIGLFNAHGFDPGPTERPLLAGAATGLLAAVPATAVLWGFGTLRVLADDFFQLPEAATALIVVAAFVVAGMIYGALFRRAAADRDGGWIFGMTFGFALWIAAPVVALPLLKGPGIAAGTAAIGFLVAFLFWGLVLGVLFPFVHRPLLANLDGKSRGLLERLGPNAAVSKQRGDVRCEVERPPSKAPGKSIR